MREEAVSNFFDPLKLESAQRRAWELLRNLASKIQPGMSEADAVSVYKAMQLASGADKYWHPPKIRFGKNTLCAFRDTSDPEVRLAPNDIFFLDLGPIYDGYEGDVGRSFRVGDFPEADAVIAAGEEIFEAVKGEFKKNKLSGRELYLYAGELAASRGYELVGDGAKGHRISDFPHAVHYRGTLRELDRLPAPHRWILEIQLRDRAKNIGAFYEDIL